MCSVILDLEQNVCAALGPERLLGESYEAPSMSRLRRAPRLRRGLRLLPCLRPDIVKHRCPGHLFIKHRCPGHRCPPRRPGALTLKHQYPGHCYLSITSVQAPMKLTSPAVRGSRHRRGRFDTSLPPAASDAICRSSASRAPIQAWQSRRGSDTSPISPVPLTPPLDTV